MSKTRKRTKVFSLFLTFIMVVGIIPSLNSPVNAETINEPRTVTGLEVFPGAAIWSSANGQGGVCVSFSDADVGYEPDLYHTNNFDINYGNITETAQQRAESATDFTGPSYGNTGNLFMTSYIWKPGDKLVVSMNEHDIEQDYTIKSTIYQSKINIKPGTAMTVYKDVTGLPANTEIIVNEAGSATTSADGTLYGRVQVVSGYTSRGTGYWQDTYSYQISGDGTNWVTVYTGIGSQDNGYTAHAPWSSSIPPLKARYQTYDPLVKAPIVAANDINAYVGLSAPGVTADKGVSAMSGYSRTKFEDYGGAWDGDVTLEDDGGISSGVLTAADIGDYTQTIKAVDNTDNTESTTTRVVHVMNPVPITKTADRTTCAAGADIVWTVKIMNEHETADTFSVTDTVPLGLTITSVSDGGVIAGRVVTWSDIALEPLEEKTLTITTKVNANRAGAAWANGTLITNAATRTDSASATETADATVTYVATEIGWLESRVVAEDGILRPGGEIEYTFHYVAPNSKGGMLYIPPQYINELHTAYSALMYPNGNSYTSGTVYRILDASQQINTTNVYVPAIYQNTGVNTQQFVAGSLKLNGVDPSSGSTNTSSVMSVAGQYPQIGNKWAPAEGEYGTISWRAVVSENATSGGRISQFVRLRMIAYNSGDYMYYKENNTISNFVTNIVVDEEEYMTEFKFETDGNGTLNPTGSVSKLRESASTAPGAMEVGDGIYAAESGTATLEESEIPTITANPGYVFDRWEMIVGSDPAVSFEQGNEKSPAGPYTGETTVTFKALFAADENDDDIPDKYQTKFTFTSGGNGSVAGDPVTIWKNKIGSISDPEHYVIPDNLPGAGTVLSSSGKVTLDVSEVPGVTADDGFAFDLWSRAEDGGTAVNLAIGNKTSPAGVYYGKNTVDLTANFEVDVVGDPDDPENGGDDVPDKYQKKVTLNVVHGTWKINNSTSRVAYVTLLDEYNNWSATGKGLFPVVDVSEETGITPDSDQYALPGTWDAEYPPYVNYNDTNTTYTYTLSLSEQTIDYKDAEKDDEGGGDEGDKPDNLPDDVTETVTYGDKITVDPAGGSWTTEAVTPGTGNTYTSAQTFEVKSDINLASDPTKTDYVFMGWKKEAGTGDVKWVFTAQWEDDKVGNPNDPDNESDGIPDKFQQRLSFEIVGGYWSGTDDQTYIKYVTLTDDGTATGLWKEDGTAAFPTASIPDTSNTVVKDGYMQPEGWVVDPATVTVVNSTGTYDYTYRFNGTIVYKKDNTPVDMVKVMRTTGGITDPDNTGERYSYATKTVEVDVMLNGNAATQTEIQDIIDHATYEKYVISTQDYTAADSGFALTLTASGNKMIVASPKSGIYRMNAVVGSETFSLVVVVPGDVNMDGGIDASDWSEVLNYVNDAPGSDFVEYSYNGKPYWKLMADMDSATLTPSQILVGANDWSTIMCIANDTFN